jgi:hypothetical protein
VFIIGMLIPSPVTISYSEVEDFMMAPLEEFLSIGIMNSSSESSLGSCSSN